MFAYLVIFTGCMMLEESKKKHNATKNLLSLLVIYDESLTFDYNKKKEADSRFALQIWLKKTK